VRPEDAPTALIGDLPQWPTLNALGLSKEELSARRQGIGGSDATIILSGNAERITRLWLEKRGAVPEDLSDRVQVSLGSWTEEFNRQWFEKVTGDPVKRVRGSVTCSVHSWRRCNLDGIVPAKKAVWEAKHTNAFSKPEEVVERYMPQLQHNMAVAGFDLAILSVIFGNHKFEIFEVEKDWLYQQELLAAEGQFWDSVKSGKPPVPAQVPLPPKPVGVREVCLEGNNGWAAAAADWLANREPAKTHASACIEIRALVEPDVARAFGHGVEAKRSKAGAISIRECEQ
jgi:hypothetical protein